MTTSEGPYEAGPQFRFKIDSIAALGHLIFVRTNDGLRPGKIFEVGIGDGGESRASVLFTDGEHPAAVKMISSNKLVPHSEDSDKEAEDNILEYARGAEIWRDIQQFGTFSVGDILHFSRNGQEENGHYYPGTQLTSVSILEDPVAGGQALGFIAVRPTFDKESEFEQWLWFRNYRDSLFQKVR